MIALLLSPLPVAPDDGALLRWIGTVIAVAATLAGTWIAARYTYRGNRSQSIDDLVEAALGKVLEGYERQAIRDQDEIQRLNVRVDRLAPLEAEVTGLREQVRALRDELQRLAGVERDNGDLRVQLQGVHGHVAFLQTYMAEHGMHVPAWEPQVVGASPSTPTRPIQRITPPPGPAPA